MGVSVRENVRVGMDLTLRTVSMQTPVVCMKMGEGKSVCERAGLQGDLGPGWALSRAILLSSRCLSGRRGKQQLLGPPRPLSQAGQGSDG